MMVDKSEVDMALEVLQAIIALVEKVDPMAQQNKVVITLNNAISAIKAVGI